MRATLTAFSTASAPELNSAERFSWSPGVRSASSSQTATYSSYGVTMKHVCVKSATCCWTPATTAGALLPTLTTAMPEPKSMRWLPSTSTRIPPPARSMYAGSPTPTPEETVAALRACSACDFGPGKAVTSLRCWSMGEPGVEVMGPMIDSGA